MRPTSASFLASPISCLGQDDAAIDQLRATIALGDSAYLEDAHFYLAKAFLRRKDLGAAETQLKKLIELRGSRSDEAQATAHCRSRGSRSDPSEATHRTRSTR